MINYEQTIIKASYPIPKEYVPVSQAAFNNNVPASAIHRLIHARAIPYLKMKGRYFVRHDLVIQPAFRQWDDRTYWLVKNID